MIIFDLKCAPQGHVFEAWFGSGEDYEGQRARGLVACPLCGAADVDKAPMAPNIPGKGSVGAQGGGDAAPAPEAVKTMLADMAAAQKKMLAGSDFVGERFADEAGDPSRRGRGPRDPTARDATGGGRSARRGDPGGASAFPVPPPRRELTPLQ